MSNLSEIYHNAETAKLRCILDLLVSMEKLITAVMEEEIKPTQNSRCMLENVSRYARNIILLIEGRITP